MSYQRNNNQKTNSGSNSVSEAVALSKGLSFPAVPALQMQGAEVAIQMKKIPAQLMEEEEPLQGKFETIQRVEEEEPLQGKFETIQKVEEEEPLQGKFETIQKVEEEEPLQGKFETIQKVEEEEPLQGKFETIQRVEEEEPLQGKFETVQRVEEEEPLQGKFETIQKVEVPKNTNQNGLPGNLKSGIEQLSGYSMDDVKVHYNSSQPAQLQALAYAQGTDIHIAPGQEKHLPHEAWHVAQQKQGRVKPTLQMKTGVPVNDDAGLENEADVMGQKAQSVGMISETGNDIGTAQRMEKEVIQGKFTLVSSPQFSKTQPIQLSEEGKAIAEENNVTKKQIEEVRERQGMSLKKIQEETKLTLTQITTAQARLFGETKVQDMPEKVDGVRTEGPNSEPRAANPWDKWFIDKLSEEDKAKVVAAKAKIPRPEEIFTQDAIAKHLSKFADGAHAFIDPNTSGKIRGDIEDIKFKGWGLDANFVTPLVEAEALHQKAMNGEGIITLENELGIGKCNWSRTDWNPKKEMVRWRIPKPLNLKLENNIPFLSMATGNETGALVNEWVAGGFTLGGMTEAVVQAIPRDSLMKSLIPKGEITNETVVYANTPNQIFEDGPVKTMTMDEFDKPTKKV